MKLILGFVLLLIVTLSLATVPVTVHNSLEQFKADNPDANIIELDAYDHQVDDSRSYSVGARQTGDVVVANASNKKKWPSSQNVTTTLTYPTNGGNGAYVTYILINCEQASNLGRAYIIAGGVNQHFVQIIIEAQITSYFNYSAFFYGIK